MRFERIGVVGAGAWGSALANIATRAGRRVSMFVRDPLVLATTMATRENPRLPGIGLDHRVAATAELAEAVQSDAILLVVPAQALRAAAAAIAPLIVGGVPVVACAKGIESGTRLFMTQVIGEVLPRASAAILSGPSFAADVARGLPTAVTLAAGDDALAAALAGALHAPTFRPYHSVDVR